MSRGSHPRGAHENIRGKRWDEKRKITWRVGVKEKTEGMGPILFHSIISTCQQTRWRFWETGYRLVTPPCCGFEKIWGRGGTINSYRWKGRGVVDYQMGALEP